jgi:peptide/nickel transport system permease protein
MRDVRPSSARVMPQQRDVGELLQVESPSRRGAVATQSTAADWLRNRALLEWARRGGLVGLWGGAIVLLLVLLAAAGGLLTPYDPIAVNLVVRLQPPSLAHPFGTDEFGRDVLSRVIQGTRISLLVASISVVVATVLGVALGLVSGYLRGWTDFAIQRVNEVLLAFPGLLLALAIVGGLGPGLNNVMIAVGLASSPFFIRVVRGAVLSIRERDYILAARLIGARDRRIMLRHIAPNAISPIVVLVSQQVGWSILATAALSFLGLGAQPPTPEWGTMLSHGRDYMRDAWWIAAFPGLAIVVTVLGFNLLGDSLLEAMNPRGRR